MAAVMIGIDPHKASHTAVAIDEGGAAGRGAGACLSGPGWAVGGVGSVLAGADLAVEGAGGLGYLLAQQLVAAGERVLDVQPKLGARVRLLATGATSKNDPNDARSVAIAALRSAAPRKVAAENHAAVLKVVQAPPRPGPEPHPGRRLHAVLCEAIPGGITKEIVAAQAANVLEGIEPSGAVEVARCELAAEFLDDLRRIDAQLRDTKKRLTAAVRASGTTVTEVFGVGPVIAATVTGYVADASRFPSRDNFAAYDGTAPIEVSSGNRKIYRLSRRGNRAPEPRHPHGRGHPDPAPPQRRAGLLRPQARRRQDPQRSPPFPQAARQRRHLQPPASRRPQGRRIYHDHGPGRATGNGSVASAAGRHPEHRLFGPATPEPDITLRRPGRRTPTGPGPAPKKTRTSS